MHHYVAKGRLEPAARLALYLGEHVLTRALVAAHAERMLRWLADYRPTQSPSSAGSVLELAAEAGARLSPEHDDALRHDLHETLARWRGREGTAPAWAEQLEGRLPRP